MKKRLPNIGPLVLVLVGLAILLYPTISNYLIEQNSSRVIERYSEAVSAMSDEERQAVLDTANEYNAALALWAGAVPSGESDSSSDSSEERFRILDQYEEILNSNGDGTMGYIIIPKMNVELPIYHTVEEKVLQVGVGHLENTSLPVGGPSTHASLSGHRGLPSAKLFTDLDQMEEGDQFFIKVLGETLAYEVHSVETVLPHETESLAIQEGEDLVTLITCTPYAINSHRLLVHAHRIPYVPEMDEVIEQVGGFINIPLPYLLLMIALAVLAVFLVVLKVRASRKEREEYARGKHTR